jgi:hypothetical protein
VQANCGRAGISVAHPAPSVYAFIRDAFLKLAMQLGFSRMRMLASFPIEIRAGVAAPSCEAARAERFRRHLTPRPPRG